VIETKLSGSGPLVIQTFLLSIYGARQTTTEAYRGAVDSTTKVNVATGCVEG
jgi:hypothetical protein